MQKREGSLSQGSQAKMALYTLIARALDGLELVGTMEADPVRGRANVRVFNYDAQLAVITFAWLR